ncbi:MAG: hypothetical protein M1835_004594 [Candelina submexicana]|nr:MAG: hypothetical protein M1835_004594 [Candelina submexicana]
MNINTMRPVTNLEVVLHAVPNLIGVLAKCLGLDDLLALKQSSRSLRDLLQHRDQIIAFSHIDLGTLQRYSNGRIARFAAYTSFSCLRFLSRLIEPGKIVSLDFKGAYISIDALDGTLSHTPNLRRLSVRDVVADGDFTDLTFTLGKYLVEGGIYPVIPATPTRRSGNVLRSLEVKGFVPLHHMDFFMNIRSRKDLLLMTTALGIELDYQACIDCGSRFMHIDSGWAFDVAPCKGCGIVERARCANCMILRPSQCYHCYGYAI